MLPTDGTNSHSPPFPRVVCHATRGWSSRPGRWDIIIKQETSREYSKIGPVRSTWRPTTQHRSDVRSMIRTFSPKNARCNDRWREHGTRNFGWGYNTGLLFDFVRYYTWISNRPRRVGNGAKTSEIPYYTWWWQCLRFNGPRGTCFDHVLNSCHQIYTLNLCMMANWDKIRIKLYFSSAYWWKGCEWNVWEIKDPSYRMFHVKDPQLESQKKIWLMYQMLVLWCAIYDR